MNINVTPELEKMIKKKVASGLYSSVSEVVREALRLMEEQDMLRAVKLERLRQDISDGLESGKPSPWNLQKAKRDARKFRAARLRKEGRA
jgi:antitoxin ParD1/3/4